MKRASHRPRQADGDRDEPDRQRDDGDQRPPRRIAREHTHRLIAFEGRDDERASKTGSHTGRAARRVDRRHPGHRGVLDRRQLLDPQAQRDIRRRAGRDAVGRVGRRPDGLARDDDEPVRDRVVVDGDPVETLAHLEVHGLSLLVDRRPAATVGELDADPSQHEGAVRVVLELLLGIDPAADRDEPRRSGGQLGACATGTTGVTARSRPTR